MFVGPAQKLWGSLTSVSSQGRKKGRGRGCGVVRAKNLNKGQKLGVGPIKVLWPGLNAPVSKSMQRQKIEELSPDPNYQTTLVELRNRQDTWKRPHSNTLLRGWSGAWTVGKWYPLEIFMNDENYKEFYGTQISFKYEVDYLKGKLKKTKITMVSIIGNRHGCVGWGSASAENTGIATKLSIIEAFKNVMRVPMHDNHTIVHDFTSRYDENVVHAYKMPKGYGLVCHRAVRTVCVAAGIKDIYVKNEGAPHNFKKMAKAFIIGLVTQRDFQEMADEKRLHLVEFKEENSWFPNVLASPQYEPVRKANEIPITESTSFHMYLNNGNVLEVTPKKQPDYVRTLGYGKYLQRYHYEKIRLDVRCQLRAKYGVVESFLNRREKEERQKRKLELLASTTSKTTEDDADETSPPPS